MSIQFPCQRCGQTLSVADEHAGKQARCPSCQTVQPVPNPNGMGGNNSTGGISGGGYNPSPTTISFGGSIFDPPNTNSPAPSNNDPLFGSFGSTSQPPSPSSNAGSKGGGLFDGLGVEKLEPLDSGGVSGSNTGQPDEYYLEAPGGDIYGPVDWRTLVAWKNQGRVGPGYRIRKGTNGAWQVASSTELYAKTPNPFADTVAPSAPNPTPQYQYRYSQQDRSGLILGLAIVAWVLTLMCGPLGAITGILAWLFGAQDLQAARDGNIDPRTVTTIRVGYYLGMAQVIVSMMCCGYFAIVFIWGMI